MRMDGYLGERRQAARAALNRSTQSSLTWNSFPSGSANQKIVPHSSFLTGRAILTPFLRSRASSFLASFVEKRYPVFPFSGRESGQRWRRTFEPRGPTVTQCGQDVTTRKPILSFQNFVAFFSFRTTTATVSNLSMQTRIEMGGISLRCNPSGNRGVNLNES